MTGSPFESDAGRPDLVSDALRAAAEAISPVGPVAQEEYQDRPIDWIVERLGIPEHTLRWSMNPGYEGHQWDGTPDPLVAIADGLASWEDVGVESATGAGKSFLAACLCLWFLACHENARVYSYAPKEDQLRNYMWAEIRHIWPRFELMFPRARLTDLRIRMDGISDKWGALGYAVQIRAGQETATGAHGAHAEHMLMVLEEMPGIDPSVTLAIENTCTAPHNLRLGLGNPDSQHDELHKFCQKPGVVPVRISGHDHPNVVCGNASIVPGAVSRESLDRRREEYGEGSRLYKSRARGISPPEAVDALIKREWCEQAVERGKSRLDLRDGPPALGVDVARSENGDKAAIARGWGAVLDEVEAFQCPNALELGRRVGVEIRASRIQDRNVGVDVVGVGSGTVDGLKEECHYVQALNGGSKAVATLEWEDIAHPSGRYRHSAPHGNLRSQMWWMMRLDLERGLIALPDDPELIDDLTEPVWWTKNRAIYVEPKEEIVKRLGRSPDKGDAAVYWNWVRPRRPVGEEEAEVEEPDPDYDWEFDEIVDRYVRSLRRSGRAGPANHG